MFDRVDEHLADTVNALSSGDLALAATVRMLDRDVDAMELSHGRRCTHILESYQPTGVALRTVIATMRISSSLERVGDHCKNVCKAIPAVSQLPRWQSNTPTLDLADAARTSIRNVRNAFADQNRLAARQVLAFDRQVDRGYREALVSIAALGEQNSAHYEALLHLASVCKSLERVADHAKSIARSVVYLVEGIDIRYGSVRQASAA